MNSNLNTACPHFRSISTCHLRSKLVKALYEAKSLTAPKRQQHSRINCCKNSFNCCTGRFLVQSQNFSLFETTSFWPRSKHVLLNKKMIVLNIFSTVCRHQVKVSHTALIISKYEGARDAEKANSFV